MILAMRSFCRASRRPLLLAVACLALCVATASAQEDQKELYEQDPYDLLTLTKSAGDQKLKLVPLNLPNREMPNPKPRSGRLRVRKLDEPDEEYDVNWISIERIEFFEELIRDKARELMMEKQFDRAYWHLAFLKQNYPRTRDLQQTVNEFLYLNAGTIAAQQPNRAFAMLEELYSNEPTFQFQGGRSVTAAIDGIVAGLLEDYLKAKDYASMRRMLSRLGRKYGDQRLPSLAKYRNTLDGMAAKLRDQASKSIADGDLRSAYLTTREMLGIWPSVEGGPELAEKAAKLYPIVRVGVLDAASEFDPSAIDNWASRRAGRLMVRLMTEYRGAGPEGGDYLFPWGTYERSEDLRRLTLIVSRRARTANGKPLDGYVVAARMLELADPNNPAYNPVWADLVEGVSVEAVYRVHVDLRRPSMIPESLLQVTLRAAEKGQPSPNRTNGGYRVAEQKGDTIRYVRKGEYPFTGTTQPAEVIEKRFPGTQHAMQALIDQEIDAIDRIYPAFVNAMKDQPGVRVAPYESPTMHFLVPNVEREFSGSRTFRRALLYGTDRERILNNTLLEGRNSPGSRVISGPFPAARDADDPLAYAYDEDIEPLPYFPQHSVLLGNLAQIEYNQLAERTMTKPPERPTLILAHPAGEQATLISKAIASQWNLLGFNTRLKALPPGVSRPSDDDWHFLYTEVVVREPVTDASRLLSINGVARSDNDHIGQALRRLETAHNWKTLRNRLHAVHHTVFSELIVMPLFQVIDHCAYREGLQGLGDRPAAFYQNIEFWDVSPRIIE